MTSYVETKIKLHRASCGGHGHQVYFCSFHYTQNNLGRLRKNKFSKPSPIDVTSFNYFLLKWSKGKCCWGLLQALVLKCWGCSKRHQQKSCLSLPEDASSPFPCHRGFEARLPRARALPVCQRRRQLWE